VKWPDYLTVEADNLVETGCRALHWDWDPAGPGGPDANLAGAGGFKIVVGGSGRLKIDSRSQDCW